MRPKMPQQVTITTPPDPIIDPTTGLEIRPQSPPVTSPARLSQRPVAELGSQVELRANQDTTISLWTLLVPAETVLTSRSTITDEAGRRFEVIGDPADRPNHRPQFRAAALRLISDMQ